MSVRILVGDALARLRELPAESVQCVVTSPPYWGLRDYGNEGGIGLEGTLTEHIDALVAVFREVRRVLRRDGTVWLNYGDAYAGAYKGGGGPGLQRTNKGSIVGGETTVPNGMKPKDLMMMPARVALALQEDGWWIRSEIVWHKPNPMPESVTDRPTNSHEKVYLLTRAARYFYDADAVRVPYNPESVGRYEHAMQGTAAQNHQPGVEKHKNLQDGPNPLGANLRNVWKIPTQGYRQAHFATFPEALVRPCIAAGTSDRGACQECCAPWTRKSETSYHNDLTKDGRPTPGNNTKGCDSHSFAMAERTRKHVKTTGWRPGCDHAADPIPCTVMDPFAGSGTVGLVAAKMNRSAILLELNPEYAAMAERRIRPVSLFGKVTMVGARVIAGDRSPDACLAARLKMDITAGGEPPRTIPRPALDI